MNVLDAPIMFEHQIQIIECQAREIATKADTLAWLKEPSAALDRYDLRKSAQALRDAASRLEDVLKKTELRR